MKKQFLKIAAFAMLVLVANSCSKDFLDRSPQGTQTDQNFFNQPGNAIQAVNSIYDAISWDEGPSPSGYVPHNYEFMFGDILSDDAAKGSEPTDFPALTEMEEWRSVANSAPTLGAWTNLFIAIFRANTVIANIPKATIDEDLKTRLLGEAHFLRAYAYFYGARIFGGMPLFREPVLPAEFGKITRASLADTYKFIVEDFTTAQGLLPEKSAYAVADLGRATKGAATAYLARVHSMEIGLGLNARDWNTVYDLTGRIITSGEYSLQANYAEIFEDEGENGPESIFEVQFLNSPDAWGSIKTGSTVTIFQNNRSWWGWGFNNPTQALVDAFEPGDPRLPCTVYKNDDVVYGVKQVVEYPDQNQTGYLNRKAAQPIPQGEQKSGGQNLRKIRYADVLLLRAEAAYRTGKESEARDLVNQIRTRARNSTKPKGTVEGDATIYEAYAPGANDNVLPAIGSNVSGQALLDAILHERRVELGMESLRYWDQVRLGTFVSSLDAGFQANCLARSVKEGSNPMPVLPIPIDEVQSWGIQQNPGY